MAGHANCARCGEHFHYEHKRKYCSTKCWSVPIDPAWGSGIGTCVQCGKDFERFSGRGRNKKFCSHECRESSKADWMAAHLQKKREETAIRRRREAFKRFDKKARSIKDRADRLRQECSYCGVVFVPKFISKIEGSRGTMCGKGCSTKAAADAAREKSLGVNLGDPGYPEARAHAFRLKREILAIKRIASRKGIRKQKTGCACCGKAFVPKVMGQIYCRKECSVIVGAAAAGLRRWEEEVRGKVKECKCCGVQYCMTYKAKTMSFCSSQCRKKYYRDKPRDRGDKRAHTKRRERRKAAGRTGNVSPAKICARDGWRCQGCGIDTPHELRGTYEPNAPELDHVVPLALGGAHGPENIQLLCRACNIDKADNHPDHWVPQAITGKPSRNNGLGGRV